MDELLITCCEDIILYNYPVMFNQLNQQISLSVLVSSGVFCSLWKKTSDFRHFSRMKQKKEIFTHAFTDAEANILLYLE